MSNIIKQINLSQQIWKSLRKFHTCSLMNFTRISPFRLLDCSCASWRYPSYSKYKKGLVAKSVTMFKMKTADVCVGLHEADMHTPVSGCACKCGVLRGGVISLNCFRNLISRVKTKLRWLWVTFYNKLLFNITAAWSLPLWPS